VEDPSGIATAEVVAVNWLSELRPFPVIRTGRLLTISFRVRPFPV
jgi:hypothetical protein